MLRYLEQFVPGTKRSILSYRPFRKDRSYVMMRSHFLPVLHIHSPFQTYPKTTAFREFLQLCHLFETWKRKIPFFFIFYLVETLTSRDVNNRQNFRGNYFLIDLNFIKLTKMDRQWFQWLNIYTPQFPCLGRRSSAIST